MPRRPYLNIYKRGHPPQRAEYYLETSEVRELRKQGKVPGFANGYPDKKIRVTTVTRLE